MPNLRCVAATAAALATAVVAVGQAPAAAAEPDPCNRTSWLAGTTELCGGVLVYRDYVVDDYGAANPADPTSETVTLGEFSPTKGDQRYEDGSRAGTADLVDLSLRIVGDRLVAVFETNALYEPDSTIGALAIDTDDDRATGGGTWPGLGVSSSGWDVLRTVARGDTDSNTLRLSMPVPGGTRWRVQAVTAKADGTVMNVAFRGVDEESGTYTSTWWEGQQADALADGDISRFGATVAVSDLRDGVTRPAAHTAAGFHERVFTSKYTIGTGEGYTYEPEYGRHGNTGSYCDQEFVTLGPYQPYSVYVPRGDTRKGLQLYLHGCNLNHSSQIDFEGFQQQFGDDLNRVIVAPLGRGPAGFYSDISEADVFEAMRDAMSAYRLDPQRRFISGYSMGGYGTLRLGSLYPHLWAGATNWVGFTGDGSNNPTGQRPVRFPSGAIGNAIDLVGNLEWIPSEHLYAGADELVQTQTHTALALRLREVSVDHAYYLHPTADHATLLLLDDWRKEAEDSKGRRLVANPPRVRFRTDESLAYPAYDIRHDRAYWVSRIRARHDGYSDIDLTTAACGGALPVREAGNGAGPHPVPWVSDTLRTTGTTPITQTVALTGTLSNVKSLVIDAQATCVAGRRMHYDLRTDGPAVVRLSDGRIIVLGAAGRHSGVLSAGADQPEPSPGAGVGPTRPGDGAAGGGMAGGTAPVLPATGGGALLGPLVLLGAGLATRHRRR